MAKNVGIMSPGDMGSAIGRVLADAGFSVITALERRSDLTRLRAHEAGMRDVQTLDQLVAQSDLVLSVLVPAEALPMARRVAESVRRTNHRPAYADLNAIAPQTVKEIDRTMRDSGVVFVDGGIIGSPPGPGKMTRIYCSGPDTGAVEALSSSGLDIRRVGPEIGQASGLKMVYAASTKGITALWTELMVTAQLLGLHDALSAEFKMSGVDIAGIMEGRVCTMPRRARRWVGEMEEIAKTFEAVGLTPRMLQGAADMYRLVSATPLADQTSRQPDPSPAVLLKTLAAKVSS
jgi:3-hydroxyisobutyrate dehydrogenase-like beta-hydroxyacid dehydrogenase